MKRTFLIAIAVIQTLALLLSERSRAQHGDTVKVNTVKENVPPVAPPAKTQSGTIMTPDIPLPAFRALEIPQLDEKWQRPQSDTLKKISIPVRLFKLYQPLPKPLADIEDIINGKKINKKKKFPLTSIDERLKSKGIGLSIKPVTSVPKENQENVMKSLYSRPGNPASTSLGTQNPYINHESKPHGILVGIDPYTLKPIYIVPPGTKKNPNYIYIDPK